jgi:hypothetical protein
MKSLSPEDLYNEYVRDMGLSGVGVYAWRDLDPHDQHAWTCVAAYVYLHYHPEESR